MSSEALVADWSEPTHTRLPRTSTSTTAAPPFPQPVFQTHEGQHRIFISFRMDAGPNGAHRLRTIEQMATDWYGPTRRQVRRQAHDGTPLRVEDGEDFQTRVREHLRAFWAWATLDEDCLERQAAEFVRAVKQFALLLALPPGAPVPHPSESLSPAESRIGPLSSAPGAPPVSSRSQLPEGLPAVA